MSKSMLIIEDDVVGRDLLRLVFQYEGFHCVEAENGAVGLKILDSQTFDVIILDNTMPVMSGLGFLNHLQRNSLLPDVPIIMITGLLNRGIRELATKLGAYAIMSKPYDVGELRDLVNQLTTGIPSHTLESSLMPK